MGQLGQSSERTCSVYLNQRPPVNTRTISAEVKIFEGSSTDDRVKALFDALKKSEENSDY